jgi:hypothetical protein
MTNKLYELDFNQKFILVEDTETPPGATPAERGEVYTFRKIDGMYSICWDRHRNVVHLAAWSEVEPISP